MLAGGNPVLLSVWVNLEDMSSGAEDRLFPHGGQRRRAPAVPRGPRPRGAPRRAAPRRAGSSAAPWRRWGRCAGLPAPLRAGPGVAPPAGSGRAEPSGAARALRSAPRGPGSHGRRPRRASAGSGSGPRAGVRAAAARRADGSPTTGGRADGRRSPFSARGWRQLRRFSPGGARPPSARRASEAERDGAGGARRAPRRRSP